MNEILQEYCDSRGVNLRVDGASGVLRGVKILGLESRNGRHYRPAALSGARHLYEGAKVNVNHAKTGPLAPRDYQDRIGAIRNVSVRDGEGLFGDLHFNPKHALAEQLVWDAQHATENVGFSHNVTAQTARDGDQLVVEAISEVHSVDLVADPATTRSLFEGRIHRDDTAASTPHADEPMVAWHSITADAIRHRRPDLVETLLAEQADELTRLRATIEQHQMQEATAGRRARAIKLLSEHDLPSPDSSDSAARAIVGEPFFASLLAAESDAEMRRLIEQRAQLVQGVLRTRESPAPRTPLSRDQHSVAATALRAISQHDETASGFARAIT